MCTEELKESRHGQGVRTLEGRPGSVRSGPAGALGSSYLRPKAVGPLTRVSQKRATIRCPFLNPVARHRGGAQTGGGQADAGAGDGWPAVLETAGI